ncbi:MAG TPA: enoyl-CoA hydratase-related protein [Planctomycetota bacterium]|nr:enoyl-CoA hydratase-related protein [Planctomycetota bacterium]
MSAAAGGLEVERLDGGAVARLTIARPERGNSVDAALLGALERAVRDLPAEGARAIVLAGAGEKSFCTGYDVEALAAALSGSGEDPGAALDAAAAAIARSPVPVVAAIRGAASGAGFELACACDLRVVGRSARFLMPPGRLGVVYAASGIARIAAVIGEAAVREMFALAEPVDAARAAELGLATRLVEDAAVAEIALGLARRAAGNAPLSIAGVKACLAGDRAAFDELRAKALRSRDLAEGVQAFLEKRKPRFEGR